MAAATTTAIRAAWVLAQQDGEQVLLADRWVVTEGDRIAAIARDRPADVARAIDRPGLLVLPGLINMHNHCFTEMLVRNRSEDLADEGYESTLVYGLLMPLGKLAQDTLSPAEVRAILELGILQCIKGGATTLVEIFREGLAAFYGVAARFGLRFYGIPYLFSTPSVDLGPDGKPAFGGGSADGAADVARWKALFAEHDGTAEGRIKVALGPHATDTCGPELLRAARRLAEEHGCIVTTHLSQTEAEVEHARRHYGKLPAEYLADTGLLGPDCIVAHCLYSTDAELGILKATDTTVVNCPRTFARGGRAARYARFADRGIRTVIGTDGYNVDLVSELGAAGLVSKLAARSSTVATARQLVKAATFDAARALRRDDLGRIAPGAKADLLAIDMLRPALQPVADPLVALVWRASGNDIWSSMVDGKLLIDSGRPTFCDEAAVTAAGAAAVEKVWKMGAAAGFLKRAGH